MICVKDATPKIDLECFSQSNLRTMPANNLLSDTSINVQAGKRQDLFWIVITVILSATLVITSIFKSKKKRRR